MLTMNNNSNYIRKELSEVILRYFRNNKLKENINKIPIDLNPKEKESLRCCIYKDRAMTRYRIMALLGISIENDDDEYKTLKEYLVTALKRKKIESPVLTVLDTACSSCVKVSYHVTEDCRGCLARPCKTNCPFGAVDIINGKAVIDSSRCKNCGKCLSVCPFHAVVYTPVPCEEACPVGAVKRDESGKMHIDYDKCIFCGKCTRSCPFGAVMERSQIIDVAEHLKKGSNVVAILAPSVIGQFPGSLKQLSGALTELGFSAVCEVSAGADRTAREEAAEFSSKIKSGEKMMGTSCCPAYVEAVKKHVPSFLPYLSETKTPMYYSAEYAELKNPDAVKVFIGPCIAKRYEAIRDSSADYVLTFEELGAFLMAYDIKVEECPEDEIENDGASFHSRAFPSITGVSEAVKHYLDENDRKVCEPVIIDGLTKKNIKLLKAISTGKVKGNLFEVMACEGGCICGPGVVSNPGVSLKKLKLFLEEKKRA